MKTFFALVGLCVLGSALGAVTDQCANTAACGDASLVCQSNKCRTKIGQGCASNSKDECVEGAAPCPAAANSNCKCPTGAPKKADDTGCQACTDDKVVSDDMTKCVAKVGGGCANDGECITNANCPAAAAGQPRTCQCKDNYVKNAGNTKCLKIVGQTCTGVAECLENGACPGSGNNKRCACANNYVASYANNSCGLAPGQACQNGAKPCGENSACTSGTCSCNTDFVASSNQRCGKKSGAACQNDNQCVNDAACSAEKKCACKTGYKADGNGFCKKSGASAVMASTVLLLAALVTSRWM